METSPNVSKCDEDVVQSECLIPGEAGLADVPANTNSKANWGAEPNFNLNLNLTSPRNPHSATETSKLHGGNKKHNGNKGGGKPGSKGAVSMETDKSASTLTTSVERDDPSKQKSKIPALSRSPTAEAFVNSRGEQRLKSPNPKHTPTVSPKMHTHGKMAAISKPHQVEQTMIASSPRTTERVKTQTHITSELTKTTNKGSLKMQTNKKEDCGKEISLETQSPKTLHLPVSPRVHSQKEDLNVISPKLTNRTPTITAKTQKPEPASMTTRSKEQPRHDSISHSSDTPPIGPKSQNQRAEMAMLSTNTPQQSSLSPKPSTHRKSSGTRNTSSSGSKENLDDKNSRVCSGSKTSSKSSSNPEAMTATKDRLDSKTGSDSKAGHKCKTPMGSKDSLDTKSGSASKSSWGSKDSLDSKTGTNSKASPNGKSGMGSRDSLDSKPSIELNASKTGLGSKTVVWSKDDLDPKASLDLKTSPSSTPGSNSDVFLSCKPSPTCMTPKPSLAASGSKMDLVVSSSSSRTGLSGYKDNNLKAASSSAKPSPDLKTGSDSSKPGPVRSSSKSALADLSSSLKLSPRPASRSPVSGLGKGLGSSLAGPNREVQKSPGSATGNIIHRV